MKWNTLNELIKNRKKNMVKNIVFTFRLKQRVIKKLKNKYFYTVDSNRVLGILLLSN